MLPELWCEIIKKLDCKSVLNFNLSCKYLNNLITKNNLYMIRKFHGFPRNEGRCKNYNITNLFCDNFGNIPKENESKITMFIEKGIQYDFIRGDVVWFGKYKNKYSQIFDGQKLIGFNIAAYDILCWPYKFKVINNNVPISYWFSTYSALIWFDSTEVHEQCIKNITFDSDNTIYTTFNYNNKDYTLKYNENEKEKLKRTNCDSIKNLQVFFYTYKFFACPNIDPNKNNTTIYINEDNYTFDEELGCSLYEYFLK